MDRLLLNKIFDKELDSKELIQIRREFHMYPEVSGEEYQTMERIAALLDQWKIPYTKGVAKTGVVVRMKGNRDGKNIALRADMDALGFEEMNKELPYCSRNKGVMHGCGHDVHMTILLGAIKMIQALDGDFPGSFTFIFHPDEEGTGGAARMIQEGCLKNPEIDHVLGLHVEPAYPVGKIGVVYGKMYAASDMITLKVYGKSSHGAQPQNGADAIVITANIINTIQTVISRNTDPTDAAVCTMGRIEGGNVRNQLAEYVQCEGIIRTLDPQTRISTRNRIKQICESTAAAMGGRAELEIRESYGPLITDRAVTDLVCQVAKDQLGRDSVVPEPGPQLTVEDFSYFAAACPSGFYHLGCASPDKTPAVPLHNSRFDVDESCIAIGVRLQTELALRLAEQGN